MWAYIGTYSRNNSKGIYVYRMDGQSGELIFTGHTAETQNPSFLAFHPNGRYLYAVNEVGDFQGKPHGAVSAFAIDALSGALTFLNQQSSHGAAPCHLAMDATGRYVLVANYSGGNLAVLPVREDGHLDEATDVVQHTGSSVDPKRQGEPHAHSINLGAANRLAFAADLGLDKVLLYQLDLAVGKLRPHETPWAPLHPGAGPRHLSFHPSGRYTYVINELDSTVTAFAYDEPHGTLREVHSVSALPEGFSGTSHCADIHVAPSGRFLYGSNRGHDSIAIFAVDEATGRLTLVGHQSTQGRTPRNFALDPAGTFLLAANQDSDNIVVFRINAETGRLTPTGQVIEVPAPVCVRFLPVQD